MTTSTKTRSPARRTAARVLPSGLKRVLHRLLSGTRVLPETVSQRGRTTGAPLVLDSAVPVLRPNLSAHIPCDHARQVGSQYYLQ